jgi:hypothetical protein
MKPMFLELIPVLGQCLSCSICMRVPAGYGGCEYDQAKEMFHRGIRYGSGPREDSCSLFGSDLYCDDFLRILNGFLVFVDNREATN